MVPFWSLLPTPWIPIRPFRPHLHASTSSPTAPYLVGHEPFPFFLGLKIKGENVIPEGISKEGSEPSHGSPLELLSPYLVRVQLLGDSVDLQPCLLPLTPHHGNYVLGPSMSKPRGLYTCTCPLQNVAVAMQVSCLPGNRHGSPTMVPQPVYLAATSKVRFRVRNL